LHGDALYFSDVLHCICSEVALVPATKQCMVDMLTLFEI